MISSIFPLISVDELFQRLEDPTLAIFDTSVVLPSPRFDGDYRVESGETLWREAHIPTAQHLDLTHDLSDTSASFSFALPAMENLAKRFSAQGINHHVTPILYDNSDGFWAARTWWMLRSIGITARILNGGYQAWKRLRKPIAKQRHTQNLSKITKKSSYTLFNLQPQLWCNRKQVLDIVEERAQGTLVCALSNSVFNGTSPTRYSRRGHIPGSLNLPARALFDTQGFYRPVTELKQILQPLMTDTSLPFILYCGGGISAAVLAVALTQIGQDNICIYDGSLQEWSADPNLPLVCQTF